MQQCLRYTDCAMLNFKSQKYNNFSLMSLWNSIQKLQKMMIILMRRALNIYIKQGITIQKTKYVHAIIWKKISLVANSLFSKTILEQVQLGFSFCNYLYIPFRWTQTKPPLGFLVPTYVVLTWQITSVLFKELLKSNIRGKTSDFLF